ncbi:MAG: hypothetical protein ACE145_18455 [Terriglobia bacterium]
MVKALFWAAVLLCIPWSLLAQDVPQVEVFTGYSYLRASDSHSQPVNQNGWDLSVAANFSRSFSLVADISNHYGTKGGAFNPTTFAFNPIGTGGKGLSFLFGPRASYRGVSNMTPFAQMLFGGMRASELAFGPSEGGTGGGFGIVSDPPCPAFFCIVPATSFAMALGGGLDVKATDRIWIRVFQADYVRAEITTGYGTIATQNDLRISAGIVFRLGKR